MYHHTHTPNKYIPWNKGKLIGQKPPLKLKEICAIRTQLLIATKIRDLALSDFNHSFRINKTVLVILNYFSNSPRTDLA